MTDDPAAVAHARADARADDAVVRATFESAPDGLVVLAGDGRILAYNQRFLALWSFPPDMLARRDATEMRLFTAQQLQDPQAYLASLALLAETSRAQVFDQLTLADGRVFERHVSPLQVPQEPGALVVRWRDISARRRAEVALAESQARLADLFALLDLAMMDADMVYWDIDLRANRVNTAGKHLHSMLGYAPGEVADTMEAWDALVHPDDVAARDRAWDAHVQGERDLYEAEFRMRHRDGHWVWLHGRGRAVARDERGMATRVVGIRIDISHRKRTEEHLQGLAHTDALTGLLNRRRFAALAADEASRAQRHGQPLALLMIDLDRFKSVNDRLGHAGGDEVLRSFAHTAQQLMRQGDVLARVGGEEFAVLLPQTGEAGALALAQRLCQHVQDRPALVNGQPLRYTVSIGVAVRQATGPDELNVERLMAEADLALYQAKDQGRNRVVAA